MSGAPSGCLLLPHHDAKRGQVMGEAIPAALERAKEAVGLQYTNIDKALTTARQGRMVVVDMRPMKRAAEELVFGHFSTGAADDLQKVTAIARAIVARNGMHRELGPVVYENERQNYLGQIAPSFGDKPYSEATAREIDLAVRDIVSGMYRKTLELLHARESLLRESAAERLERETLGQTDLERFRELCTAPVLPLPKAA